MRKVAPAVAAALFCAAVILRANSVPPGLSEARSSSTAESKAASPYAAENATIATFCSDCHNDSDKIGDMSLDKFDVAHASDNAALAEKMVRKLRAGMMPPKSAAQPDDATRAALVTALETSLDKAAATPNPGYRSFQRLNRAEYAAAVRAMLGLDVDVAAYLPADTISAGFDNIADAQTPSATVMQGYLRAAAYVSRAAIGDPAADPGSTIYEVPRTKSQKDRVEGAPFGTRGGTVVMHNFLADGQYKFQMLLHGEPTGLMFGRTARSIQLDVSIDGERVALIKVDRWLTEADKNGLALTTEPIAVKAGPHRVAAPFMLSQYCRYFFVISAA